MVTRRQRKRVRQRTRQKQKQKQKQRTQYRQRGGYDITVLEDTMTFTDPKDEDEFTLDFNSFISDANEYFTGLENPGNPINPQPGDDANSVFNRIRDITVRYADYLSLQSDVHVTPGDILYYDPTMFSSSLLGQYPFGHIETIIGTVQKSTGLSILHTHPTQKSGGVFDIFDSPFDLSAHTEKIHVIRYTGNKAPLIRATSAFLSKLFIDNKMIDYDFYLKKMVAKFVHGSTCREDSREEIIRRVNKTKEKLKTHEKLATVCSGFSILMCELAFIIHGMEAELFFSMPLDAKACTPTQFYDIVKTLPEYWTLYSFYRKPKSYSNLPNVLNLFHTKR
jgi:hypothetical protein